MKKSLSILLFVFSITFSIHLKAQLITNSEFTTPNSGWYRLGYWDANERGSVRIAVALRGGSHTPQSVIIDAFKNWSSELHMDIKGIENHYIEQVRIVEDSGPYYIEAYFDRAILNHGYIHLYSLEGSETGFTINSGQLPSGEGNVRLESGDVTFTTQFDNNLDLKADLSIKGKLSIGTPTTGTHKLAVEGSIGAREIKVEASNWSDFVFNKDYKLLDLEDVENYIEENKHLPDIPSEKEVLEKGINLGDMDAKLLQKIEELTLYTIEQEKKIGRLERENKKIKLLENKLNALKKKL